MARDGDDSKHQAPGVTATATEAGQFVRQPLDRSEDLGLPTVENHLYEVRHEHARGGMGRIIVARDKRLGRTVAVKELLVVDARSEERFIREALVTARLQHPSIVPVHEAGRWPDGSPFYTMKMVTGRSLKEVIAGTSSFKERIALLPSIVAIAEAIAYAHSQGVIHRDLKPSNVLIGEYGETVVVDWGLAKVIAEAADPAGDPIASTRRPGGDLTASGNVVGTPVYMPPEQARGEPVDERADVYSIGVILYHTLAGAPPFGGKNEEVLKRLRDSRPVMIAERVPEVPRDLAAIVDRAMDHDARRRYANAGDLAADLVRFQTGRLVQAHGYSVGELLRRWASRNRTLAVAIASFVALALLGSASFMRRERALRIEAESARDRARLEATRADRQTAALLGQEGRSELQSGHPLRAAPYLSALLSRDPGSLTARYEVSQSLRAMRAIAWKARLQAGAITSLSFSADDRWLVASSADRSVAVIDAARGTIVSRYSAPANPTCASFSRSGEVIVIGMSDGGTVLVDAETGVEVRRLEGQTNTVVSCAFSPDGGTVLTASRDGSVSLWNVASGTRSVLAENEGSATSARFSPDGRSVMATRGTSELEVFAVDTHARRFRLSLPGEIAMGEFCGPSMIATTSRGDLQLWNTDSGRLLRSFVDDHALLSPRCTRSGTRVLAVTADRRIRVWETASGEQTTLWSVPQDAAWAAFTEEGTFVVSMSNEGVLREFYAASGDMLFAVDLPGTLAVRPVMSDDEDWLAYGTAEGTIYTLKSLLGSQLIHRPVARHALYRMACIDACTSVVAGDAGGVVTVVRVDGSASESFQAASDALWRLHVSADATRILTASGHTVRLWDRKSHRMLAEFRGPDVFIYDAALSPDGKMVATADIEHNVRLWDARTGALLGEPLAGAGMSLAFSPDGQRLATGRSKIIIWDVQRRKRIAELEGHPGTSIDSLAFDATGNRLVSAGWDDHVAKVWNVGDGRLMATLVGHSERLMAAEFSPDGETIATGSFDRTARLWSARTGELLRNIPGPVHAVTFSSEGNRLLTGIGTSMVVWDITVDARPPDAIAEAVAVGSPWRLDDGRLILSNARAQ